MSPTVDRVRTNAPSRPSSEISLTEAAKRATKGEAFTIGAPGAAQLVGAIPPDIMGLRSDKIEKGDKGWTGSSGAALVEVRFANPVEHGDGPFARAFLDPEKQRVWFMKVDESTRLDSRGPPPADLLGSPPNLKASVVGDISVKKIAAALKLEPALAPSAPKPPTGGAAPADGFAPVSERGSKLPQKELARLTREYLLANMGDDKLLPAVDGGNLGSAALMLNDGKAAELLGHMKDQLRGVPEVQAFQFDPKTQQLFAVIDSQDEIHLHVGVIDQRTGKISFLSDFNTVDLPELPDAEDPTIAHLDNITKGGKWLSLGTGDAGPNWWR